jgi:hypothetical protein
MDDPAVQLIVEELNKLSASQDKMKLCHELWPGIA